MLIWPIPISASPSDDAHDNEIGAGALPGGGLPLDLSLAVDAYYFIRIRWQLRRVFL